jgi:hypothetical protein
MAPRTRLSVRAPGQAIVEFGIIILLLLLVVGGLTDLALYQAANQIMIAATGEAARQVAYGNEPQSAINITQQTLQGTLINGQNIAVRITYCYGATQAPPTNTPAQLPCTATGKSFCAGSPPAPPASAITGAPTQCYGANATLADAGANAPAPGDWALVAVSYNWVLFTPLTTALMHVYGADCPGLCQTRIQPMQLVAYPGPPPPPT